MHKITNENNPTCPTCKSDMLIDFHGSLEIWKCPKCNGIIYPLFA